MNSLQQYLVGNPKSHLIFDLDLTLVELVWPGNTRKQIREYFNSVDPELALKISGLGYTGYNMMIEKYGKSVKKELDSIYIKCESQKINEIKKINTAMLSFIRSNKQYKYYIWSNNQRQTIEKILKKYHIKNTFSKIVSGSDVALFKPDIEGFNLIYEPRTDKRDYLMIGDSENDKLAAINAGIDYYRCLVTSGQ
jgi:HAD superfamily hydrolase (TIGR01549 family)